jgi:subtilase family serine protease
MNRPRTRRRLLLPVLVGVVVGLAALVASAGRVSSARHVMTPASGIGSAALYRSIGQPLANATGDVQFQCQQTDPVECFGPAEIRGAYDIQPLLDRRLDGSGKTIAIIDAFGSPTIKDDLGAFDSLWSLPDPPSFQVVTPFGVDPTDPDTAAGWAGETSLDVEWAHAVAPGANIVLVVAKSDLDTDLLDATQWVLDHNAADVLSQSYGGAEECTDSDVLSRQHDLFHALTRRGITLLASSGDEGAGQFTCDGSGFFKAASTPASDPYVTSVGGTTLTAHGASGDYGSETTWNETDALGVPAAGGGGVSVIYDRPDFQAGASHDTRMRTVPDVSYNASVTGGVIVVWGGDLYGFGGTSAGTAQWAGLVAIADQIGHGRIGAINKPLYQVGRGFLSRLFFHDVADGSNNSLPDLTPYLGDAYGTPIDGFTADRGYDAATGLGTPIASRLVPWLAIHAFRGDVSYGGNPFGGRGHGGGHGPGRKHEN